MYKMLSIWRRQFYFPLFLLLSVLASQTVGMMFVKMPRPQSRCLPPFLALLDCSVLASIKAWERLWKRHSLRDQLLGISKVYSRFISLSQIFASQDGVILVATVTSQVVHAPRG